jgi:predicted DNA-binding antitoxin AbrB/MazE fold protein
VLLTIEAVYENSVLKPKQPLSLTEHQTVQIFLQTQTSPLLAAYSSVDWKGSTQVIERLALDPEFDPLD